jgi:hypothetical protein
VKLVRRIGPTASVNLLALLKYACAASALIIDKPIGTGFADVHGLIDLSAFAPPLAIRDLSQ